MYLVKSLLEFLNTSTIILFMYTYIIYKIKKYSNLIKD